MVRLTTGSRAKRLPHGASLRRSIAASFDRSCSDWAEISCRIRQTSSKISCFITPLYHQFIRGADDRRRKTLAFTNCPQLFNNSRVGDVPAVPGQQEFHRVNRRYRHMCRANFSGCGDQPQVLPEFAVSCMGTRRSLESVADFGASFKAREHSETVSSSHTHFPSAWRASPSRMPRGLGVR